MIVAVLAYLAGRSNGRAAQRQQLVVPARAETTPDDLVRARLAVAVIVCCCIIAAVAS